MSQLNCHLETDGERAVLTLTGVIDESSFFPTVPLSVKALKVDFSQVAYLNSMGIACWIVWIKNVGKTHKSLKLEVSGVPPIVVKQMNSIDGFLPEGASVSSFEVPHFCEGCDTHRNILLKNGTHFTVDKDSLQMKIPPVKCTRCQAIMEPDVVESQYFQFLEASKKSA